MKSIPINLSIATSARLRRHLVSRPHNATLTKNYIYSVSVVADSHIASVDTVDDAVAASRRARDADSNAGATVGMHD